MGFEVSDGADVDVALGGISREGLWLEVHQLYFAHSIFIDDDLTLEVIGQIGSPSQKLITPDIK